MWIWIALAFALGLLIGAVVTAVLASARAQAAQASVVAERDVLRAETARLGAGLDEQQELAMTLAPLSSSLARVERQVAQLERERATQWGRLDSQLSSVAASGEDLRRQTAELAGALRSSGARGTWGEVQLRRVVEHAGMLANVDFHTQADGVNDNGRSVRPDLVVRLPGGKQIAVDAKTPLAEDDHAQARALRLHVDSLAGKRYWTAFEPAPEFVVCFLPTEGLLVAACRADPDLLEKAMAKRVIIATPTTLLALMRTVALTWQQDALVGNAKSVVQLGRELHERLTTLGSATTKLGRTLNRAVEDYNALVTSTERDVLERARRLGELGVSSAEIPIVPTLDVQERLRVT